MIRSRSGPPWISRGKLEDVQELREIMGAVVVVAAAVVVVASLEIA